MTACHHRDEAGPQADPQAGPQARPALSLDAEALFVVGLLRAWTMARRSRGAAEATPDWRHIIALASLPTVACQEFGGFMAIVMHAMRRPLDIRCCPCPQVGRDEEAMLRIIGALQRGDRLGAMDDLADWLSPDGVVPALRLAERLAAILQANEICLAEGAVPPPPRPAAMQPGVRH